MTKATWQLAQDLGPGPHHHIALYRGMDEVAVFNRERREWAASDHAALTALVAYLNRLEDQR
jgi:hypothetical protein